MSHGEANAWQPRTTTEISADTKAVEELLTAAASQTLFTLTTFSYAPSTGALEVHKNGLLLVKDLDWVEQTSTTFVIVTPCNLGDKVVASGHTAITAAVDVRDTDIFIANYQAIRDYTGTEVTLYAQGKATPADGGEYFFQKFTGAAPGTFVDNDGTIIVPTGGDGSIGWTRTPRAIRPFDTLAIAVANTTITDGDVISLAERVTGDGGGTAGNGGVWDVVLSSTVTENTFNIVQCTGVATLSLVLRVRSIAYLTQWGGSIDGATDDSVIAQAMIDFMELKTAGIVDFDRGTVAIANKLFVDEDNVLLAGHGRGSLTGASKVDARAAIATRLLWVGAANGTMLEFTSNRLNDNTRIKRVGGGIIGIGFDGNESADVGVLVTTWNGGTFNFLTCYFQDFHWMFNVLSNGASTSAPSTQGNFINIVSHDVNTTSEANTLGIFHGSATDNFSLNTIEALTLTAEKSAIALELGGCDGNVFSGLVRTGTRTAATGNGGKIIIHADDTITTVPQTGDHARFNFFASVQATEGITAKATIAGTRHSEDNVIVSCSAGNGAPFPTVEAGATLSVGDYNGSNRASSGVGSSNYTVHRPSATANQSLGGGFRFVSENDADALKTYARYGGRVVDPASGSEDGRLDFFTLNAGAESVKGFVALGQVMGAPTGGDKGLGTYSAENGFFANNIPWQSGSGTPEGAVTAPVGSLFSRSDGGAGTSFYVKESGAGNTGWVAK